MALPDIQDLDLAAMERWCADVGEPRYRAAQVLAWVHHRGADDFAATSNLGKVFRQRLAETFAIGRLARRTSRTPPTGRGRCSSPSRPTTTTRAASIESVLIPQTDRPGRARSPHALHLEPGGWMGADSAPPPAWASSATSVPPRSSPGPGGATWLAAPAVVTNVVLMGMGEPLANYDAVRLALEILTAEWGYAISPRRITVSTVGLAPLVPRFIAETRVNLAVSLHGTTDEQRERLVPVNRRYPIATLLAACREVPLARRKRITFEYVMLSGENDADADARRLVGLLHGLRAKVNLIPFNPFPGVAYAEPAGASCASGDPARARASATIRESRPRHPGGARPARRDPPAA
jgi:23S rRNA (adenine2503-C2)-methyltransferase